jgi:hypothetical protein
MEFRITSSGTPRLLIAYIPFICAYPQWKRIFNVAARSASRLLLSQTTGLGALLSSHSKTGFVTQNCLASLWDEIVQLPDQSGPL